MEDREYLILTEELQRLRDEQERLRAEQAKLRREKTDSSNGNGGGSRSREPGEVPKNSGEGEGKRKTNNRKGPNEKAEGNTEEGETSDDERKSKPPLKERAREFMHTHPKEILFGTIGLAMLCILGVLLMLYLRSYESTDDAQVDGHLNAISSRINGTVKKVYVENNQQVTAGQLLVELDPRDYQTMLDQARAGYASAQAQLEGENPNVPITVTANTTNISTTNSDVHAAQAGVAAAEQQHQARLAELRQAEANNLKAQTDVLRYRPLVEKGEVSKEQFDSVVAQAKTQAAAVDAAEAGATAAQKAIDQSRDQLRQANLRMQQVNENAPRNVAIRRASVQAREAAVQSAKAQLEQAELNLSYTKIYAPVSGIVNQKTVEIGQRLEVGQELLSITQLDDIWITANFKETQLRKMRTGQPVDVSVDAYDRKYRGYVESMPGATGAITSLLPPENATGNYVKVVQRLPVRIRLKPGEDMDHILRPGMSVEPKVWLR